MKIWELKFNLAKALPAKFKTVIKYKSCAPAAETSGKLTFLVVFVFWVQFGGMGFKLDLNKVVSW